MRVYKIFVDKLGWDLQTIDNTDFETLVDFLYFKDPDVKIVNGKEYRRSKGVPTWL